MPRISRFTPLERIPAVVLDTETTGLDVATCKVLQISAVGFADGQLDRGRVFDRLVNPGVPIPARSTAIHGIDDAMVAGAPAFAAVQPELEAFLGDAVIVGQSIGFDLAVLFRETREAGLHWRQPQFLDTKLLAAALDANAAELGLDELAARLGVRISDRHRALGDALVTAEVFARLLPRLAAAGVRTLGDAEARANAQTRIRARHASQGWYDTGSVRPADAFESGSDASTLARLDAFAYRNRVEHVMNREPVIVAPSTRLADALRAMAEGQARAALAGDAAARRIDGILTQGDALRALARDGAAALDARVEAVMSAPVMTMPQDAFVYRALARLQRLDVEQLAIEDASRRVVGLLSLRDILRQEAGEAVVLGDRLSTAATPRDLASARADLPALVRRLIADGVDAPEITAVVGAELRELLARAAMLAEKRMETEGAGRPPVAYALLALGRLGRGECLLGAELEHALVYASDGADGHEARWFAAWAEHLADVLRGAGGAPSAVAATQPDWRRGLEDWRAEIGRWCAAPQEARQRAARFYDFRLAYGDQDLADDLRTVALDPAVRGSRLPRALSPGGAARAAAAEGADPERRRPPHSRLAPDDSGMDPGVAGQERLDAAAPGEESVDLVAAGLEPIEAAARALAVATGITALSTAERLAEACLRSGLSRHTADELTELHDQLLGALLAQQDHDLAAGRPVSTRRDLAGLPPAHRRELEAALGRAARVHDVIRMALALV